MKLKIFFSLLVLPIYLQAAILETKSFKDVLNHIEHVEPSEIIVICDIDNTLLEAAQQLGSVAWGEHLIADLKRKGISDQQAHQIEDIMWGAVQKHVKVKTVDPCTSEVIKEIQGRNIPVLGLTARSPADAECTRSQLQSVGIDLVAHDLFPSSNQELLLQHAAIYERGILFATPFNRKSHVLCGFLDKNKIMPKCVIFVDDKRHHVHDIEQALEARGISCIGIRFGGADEQARHFDAEIADIQWKALPKLISDHEARCFAQ